MVPATLIVGPAVLIAVLIVYTLALRTRHHYTSMLACPHCGRTFAYDWVPLASFSAVRLGSSRYLQCPLCKEWSTFDIKTTRTERGAASPPQRAGTHASGPV